MSGDVGKGHLVHYLSPHGGMFHAIASGFGSLDAKGDWSKVTCPACLAHHPAPDAAGIEAALADVLAAHAHPGEVLVSLGDAWRICGCGERFDLEVVDRIVKNPNGPWFAHVAAALLPVVTQAQAEAWERGNNDGLTFAAAPQKSLLTNPYRARADESGA